MLYAILCYNAEVMTSALPKAQDDAMMAALTQVQAGLRAQGKLGPVARLIPRPRPRRCAPAASRR